MIESPGKEEEEEENKNGGVREDVGVNRIKIHHVKLSKN